jgi:putative transposase
VGLEVFEAESAEHATTVVRRAYLREGIAGQPLVLHSDNGAPMKGATLLATLQKLGVVPSFSRPSVSNDNPYSEALFRTLKYVPSYSKLARLRPWSRRETGPWAFSSGTTRK